MKAGGKIMIESILTKATEDTYFKPFPHNLRQRLKTRIVIVNEIPKMYLCKKICDLDFWNDISGFIHNNYNYGHKVVDTTNGEVEIPHDVEVTNMSIDSSFFLVAAGDYFINKDYEVYRCYGWENASGGAEIYFDFI